jgi:hypothetical protein
MVTFDDTCKKQRCGDHPGLRFELNAFAHRVARPRRRGGLFRRMRRGRARELK